MIRNFLCLTILGFAPNDNNVINQRKAAFRNATERMDQLRVLSEAAFQNATERRTYNSIRAVYDLERERYNYIVETFNDSYAEHIYLGVDQTVINIIEQCTGYLNNTEHLNRFLNEDNNQQIDYDQEIRDLNNITVNTLHAWTAVSQLSVHMITNPNHYMMAIAQQNPNQQ